MNESESQFTVRSTTGTAARLSAPSEGELMQAIADIPPPSLEFADLRVSYISPLNVKRVFTPAASGHDVVQAWVGGTPLAPPGSGKWTVLVGVELIVDEPGTALLSASSIFQCDSDDLFVQAVFMHIIRETGEEVGGEPVSTSYPSPGAFVFLPPRVKLVDSWLFPVAPGPERFWLMAVVVSSGRPVSANWSSLSAVYISSAVVKETLPS